MLNRKLKGVRNVISEYRRPAVVRTSQPVFTISSDDWGGGFVSNVHEESVGNLQALAQVLRVNRDASGVPAVINLYTVAGRPDFSTIAASQFQKYFGVPTYQNRPDVIQVLKEGVAEKVFKLGYHGRTHFQVQPWLKALQAGNEFYLSAFRRQRVAYGQWPGYETMLRSDPAGRFLGASEFLDISALPSQPIPLALQRQWIEEGLNAFQEMFGCKPTIACAPGYFFDENTERALAWQGCKYIETMPQSCNQVTNEGKSVGREMRAGPNPETGLCTLIRNAHYEPGWYQTIGTSTAWEYKAGVLIDRAFRKQEPVILSTHAQNFTGDSDKVARNLLGLNWILKYVREKWPQVLFLDAEELGDLIVRGRCKRNPHLKVKINSNRDGEHVSITSGIGRSVADYAGKIALKTALARGSFL